MKLFVFEYLLSGADGASALSPSMLAEGRSMLIALASDFARIGRHQVVTICHRAFEPVDLPGVETVVVSSPEEERREFQSLASACGAACVIAPETSGILAERRRLVDACGGRFVGCSLEAIDLCTDKLRLFEHCANLDVPQIPTAAFETIAAIPRNAFPIVVKPRDGAGSQDTFLVSAPDDFPDLGLPDEDLANFIWQPYLSGDPVSVAAVVHPASRNVDLLPLAEQRLSADGRFHYHGGRIRWPDDRFGAVEACIRRAIDGIPGLGGYVGFDLVFPSDRPHDVRLVEINPRLTTSYLGYRALTDDNLAARMLLDNPHCDVIHWKQQTVVFDTQGNVRTGDEKG